MSTEPVNTNNPPGTDSAVRELPSDLSTSMRQLSVSETVREWSQKVKGGDMGALPALLAVGVLTTLFWSRSPYFLTKLNIANLFVQAAQLTVLSSALVFLIILTEIDLSAGVTGGTGMAVFIKLLYHGWPWGLCAVVGLLVGAATGLVIGFLVAKVGIPAFVVTLAFFLGYQGVMLVLLGSGGLFRLETKPIKAIMNSNMPRWMGWGMLVVAIAVTTALSLYDRSRRSLRGLPNKPTPLLLAKLGFMTLIGAIVVGFLNINRSNSKKEIFGVPIVVPIVLLILFVGSFVLERTKFGRYLYAVGANPEAARRAGINVTAIRISAFMICSTLAVIAASFNAARTLTIESTAGRQIVLNGVGAAVVGGVSLFGGRGNLKNAAIGAFAIAMIDNGLGLLQMKAGWNFVITGSVLVLAAGVDAISRKRAGGTLSRR